MSYCKNCGRSLDYDPLKNDPEFSRAEKMIADRFVKQGRYSQYLEEMDQLRANFESRLRPYDPAINAASPNASKSERRAMELAAASERVRQDIRERRHRARLKDLLKREREARVPPPDERPKYYINEASFSDEYFTITVDQGKSKNWLSLHREDIWQLYSFLYSTAEYNSVEFSGNVSARMRIDDKIHISFFRRTNTSPALMLVFNTVREFRQFRGIIANYKKCLENE